MTDLLVFEGVRAVPTAEVQLDFSVSGNTCVSLVGDESVGVDRVVFGKGRNRRSEQLKFSRRHWGVLPAE